MDQFEKDIEAVRECLCGPSPWIEEASEAFGRIIALREENARLKNDRDAMAISGQEAWMEVRKLREALVKVRAHTGLPLCPTGDLLLGLLNSIERITDKALSAQAPEARIESGEARHALGAGSQPTLFFA